MYLENIQSPSDVKKLNIEQLNILSTEIRTALLNKLSKKGGHIGPNLGMVEVTTALHYVFNSPFDKFVFDVSHQSYVHKILTGRKDGFTNQEKFGSITGYSCPEESEHDFFNIGHTSTSISLALGLAKGRDLNKSRENIVAIIGDGSLSGGEAFEGLNHAAENGTNLIIVVNDNDQSIAENHGGLYKTLRELRETKGQSPNNYFKALGLEYIYVEDGHNYDQLIKAFVSVKDVHYPVVVHVHTIKGKGFKVAEENREMYHWGPAFDVETGEFKGSFGGENFMSGTGSYLLDKMKKDEKVAFITSGTPTVAGFIQPLREAAGRQFIDVGIAEEHAVALASGMAKNGAKPVYGVYSTFVQRCYDQISQDLCINNNSAVILVFMGSVNGMNDVTHLGLYDIPMLSNIPNLVYLAPTSKDEYFKMLDWSIDQNQHPVAIRVPVVAYTSTDVVDNTDYSILNKYEVTEKGSEVAVLGLGSFYGLGKGVVETLAKDLCVNATLINPKFITGTDDELLENLKANHKLVITLEDGVLEGGFGEKIARFYGTSDIKVKNYGIKKAFYDNYVASELLEENGVTIPQIIADVKAILNK